MLFSRNSFVISSNLLLHPLQVKFTKDSTCSLRKSTSEDNGSLFHTYSDCTCLSSCCSGHTQDSLCLQNIVDEVHSLFFAQNPFSHKTTHDYDMKFGTYLVRITTWMKFRFSWTENHAFAKNCILHFQQSSKFRSSRYGLWKVFR